MTLKIINNTITSSISRIQIDLRRLPQQAYNYWVSITPKKTGNARRKTRLRNDTIEANYPYAVPLDEGSSSQAPDGMSRPTERFIRRQISKILRK